MQIGAVNNGMVSYNEISKSGDQTVSQRVNAAGNAPSLKPHLMQFGESDIGKGTKINVLA